MKALAILLAGLLAAAGTAGCAKDPYEDPMYTLQRDLRHQNQAWDTRMERRAMRREARDERYESWFNSVME
jgi:hypothetical protein